MARTGQTAGFLHTDVALALHDGARVLYLGDYDLAGDDIEGNIRRVLERDHALDWERLVLLPEPLDSVRAREEAERERLREWLSRRPL